MEQKLNERLAGMAITVEDIRDYAESNGVEELTDAQLESMTDLIASDEGIFAAKQEALNKALGAATD